MKRPLLIILNRVWDLVMNNGLLDCFVEPFFIACYHDCLEKDEITSYLYLLFHANTKPNHHVFVSEIFSDWKGMDWLEEEKKHNVLNILDEIVKIDFSKQTI